MALYQPTNIFPSSFAGRGGGTVDASRPLTISWQVNGSSAMTGYQIEIFQNTTASKRVYSSGLVDISPFWGVSSTGEVQYYSVTVPVPDLVNGYTSGYKLQITQFWDGGSIQQLSPSYFITRAAPSLSIQNFQDPVMGRMASFTANYTQAQGDTLDWFQWILCEAGHEDDPLEDSGHIYGSGDIQVSYDGLFTGTDYRVRCLIQTENGVGADTGWVDFTVQYQVSDMLGYVDACRHPIEGISLRWPLVSYIPGTGTGKYTVSNGILYLSPGASVTWNEKNGGALDIDTPWTLAWSGYLPTSGTSPVFEIAPGLTFHVSPTNAWLSLNGNDLWRAQIRGIIPEFAMRLVITPREVHFYYITADRGSFPAEELFPAEDLYPDAGTYAWRRLRYPLTWVQPDISSLTLHGEQRCQWLTVISGEASKKLLEDLLTDSRYEPVWTLDTRFLAGFYQGLNGGNITPVGDTITGVALYRRKEGENRLQLVSDLSIGTSSLLDEGFRNQETYTYYLFVIGNSTYVSAPLISNPITPMFWNWTILKTELENGAYHVKEAHVFRNSVSTDSITNNNAPQLLQNFTPYPNRQPSSYNYQSSTLTGYIGQVDFTKNRYADTVEQADALRALSVSQDPKFLRDRKGNLWRIETGAAVSFQTGDDQVPQPYFGTFPWVETGDVENISIISGEGDWTGDVAALDTSGRAAIVVTAPGGSTVTIAQNGVTLLEQTYTGPVTYYPAPGTYTVSAVQGDDRAAKTVLVTEDVTYYVGMVFEGKTILAASGPSRARVTVTGNGFRETKIVP